MAGSGRHTALKITRPAAGRAAYGLRVWGRRVDLRGDRDRVAGVSGAALRAPPRRRAGRTRADPADRFSDSVRIVRHGTAPLLDQDLAEIGTYEVSTPLTRRAAINDLRRLEQVAASRRRRVLLGAAGRASAVVGVCGGRAGAVVERRDPRRPAGALLRGRAGQRACYATQPGRPLRDISQGSDEKTVFLSRKDAARRSRRRRPRPGPRSSARPASCWDPVPITMPTYVSKPLAPRTVRTIDLSGPDVDLAAAARPPGHRGRPGAGATPSRLRRGRDRRRRDGCAREPPSGLTVVKSRVLIGLGPVAWGYGAVGSASRSQREGQGFESP